MEGAGASRLNLKYNLTDAFDDSTRYKRRQKVGKTGEYKGRKKMQLVFQMLSDNKA